MSLKLMAAAWEANIPSTEKMVLLCLCDFASDTGVCWPAVKTIAGKCSMSDRTVQGAIKRLRELGYCTWNDTPGKPHQFRLDPRKICTPEESAPPKNLQQTPEESAPKPLKEPSRTNQPRARKAPIPADWKPAPFTLGSESRKVVDGWPPGEEAAQLEQFKAHHRSKGNDFIDPQDAWSTWVLNSRKFGHGGSFRSSSGERAGKPTTRQIGERVAARFASGSDGVVDLVPRLGAPGGNDW